MLPACLAAAALFHPYWIGAVGAMTSTAAERFSFERSCPHYRIGRLTGEHPILSLSKHSTAHPGEAQEGSSISRSTSSAGHADLRSSAARNAGFRRCGLSSHLRFADAPGGASFRAPRGRHPETPALVEGRLVPEVVEFVVGQRHAQGQLHLLSLRTNG